MYLDPPKLESCGLVCRKWNNFIKKEMMENEKIGKQLQINRVSYFWMDAEFEKVTIPDKLYGVIYDSQKNKIYLLRYDTIECLDMDDPTGASSGVIDTGWHNNGGFCQLMLTDEYLIFYKNVDEDEATVFYKDTLEKAHSMDLSMVSDDLDYDHEDFDADYRFASVQTVGNMVYALRQKMPMDGHHISLKMFKLSEKRKGDFSLDLVCNLPPFNADGMDEHVVHGALTPLSIKVGERHVVVAGCNSRILVYNHATGKKILDEVWEDVSSWYKVEMARNFFGIVFDSTEEDEYACRYNFILADLDSGEKFTRQHVAFHPNYAVFGCQNVVFHPGIGQGEDVVAGRMKILNYTDRKLSEMEVNEGEEHPEIACFSGIDDRFLIYYNGSLRVRDMLHGGIRVLYGYKSVENTISSNTLNPIKSMQLLIVLGDRAVFCMGGYKGTLNTAKNLKASRRKELSGIIEEKLATPVASNSGAENLGNDQEEGSSKSKKRKRN